MIFLNYELNSTQDFTSAFEATSASINYFDLQTTSDVPILRSPTSPSVFRSLIKPKYYPSCREPTQSEINCQYYEFLINVWVVGLINVIGFVLNCMCIWVLRHDKNNHVATFLLQSLAAFDNFLLIISFFTLTVFSGVFTLINFPNKISYQRLILTFINPFGPISQNGVIWCTVLLAINRFIAVCKPFSSRKLLTITRAKLQVFFVAVLSLLLYLPEYFKYSFFIVRECDHECYCLHRNKFKQHFPQEIFSFLPFNYSSTSTMTPSLLFQQNFSNSSSETTFNFTYNPCNFYNFSMSWKKNYDFCKLEAFSFCEKLINSENVVVFDKNPYFSGDFYWFYKFFCTLVTVVIPLILLIFLNIPIFISMKKSKLLMKQNSLMYKGTQEKNITMVMLIIIFELLISHASDHIFHLFIYTENNNCSGAKDFFAFFLNVPILINSSTDFFIYYLFRNRFRAILKGKIMRKQLRRSTFTDFESEYEVQRKLSSNLQNKIDRSKSIENHK